MNVGERRTYVGDKGPELFIATNRRTRSVIRQALVWYRCLHWQPSDPNPFPRFHLFRKARKAQR